MLISDSNRFSTIDTYVTLTMLEDFDKDDLPVIIGNIYRLVQQYIQKLFGQHPTVIFNPLIWEVIVVPFNKSSVNI